MTRPNLNCPMGVLQRRLLRHLAEPGQGKWKPGCGWHYGGPSNTARILRSLVPRGFVADHGQDSFEITLAGRCEVHVIGRNPGVQHVAQKSPLLRW